MHSCRPFMSLGGLISMCILYAIVGGHNLPAARGDDVSRVHDGPPPLRYPILDSLYRSCTFLEKGHMAASENSTAKVSPNHLVCESSGNQAAAYIRTLIFNGDLRPGQRVPQDDIAVALGVSRIPLREA